MIECERITGIPKAVLLIAKRAGCAAFTGQRIHIAELKQWLRANSSVVATAKRDASAKADLSELKRRRIECEVEHLKLKYSNAAAGLVPRPEHEEMLALISTLAFEEAQKLMPADMFRIYRTRCTARLPKAKPAPAARV